MSNDKKSLGQTLKTLASDASALLERFQWMRQHGLSFRGDRDMYATLGYNATLTTKDYRDRYLRGGIAARIVDAYPNATWRPDFEIIEDDNPEALTALEGEWDKFALRLGVGERFLRADKLACLSTYSVLLVGFPGELNLEVPKGQGTTDPIQYLQPFIGGGGPPTRMANSNVNRATAITDADATISAFDLDPKSPRFGRPLAYKVKRLGLDDSFQREVHWSRIIHVAEGLLDDDVYGIPCLERVWNLLDDLDKVTGGGAESFWLRANQGLHLDLDKDMQLADAQAAIESLKEQAELYKHQLTRWLRTRGVKANVLGSDVADFGGPADAILTQIAGAKAIPKRILTGSEMGELASSQDRDNWKDQINGRQTGHANRLIRDLVDRLIQFNYLPAPAKEGAYEVRFGKIETRTENEKADGAQKWAGVNRVMGETVFTNDEIREHWYGKKPLSSAEKKPAQPPQSQQFPRAARSREAELMRVLANALAAKNDEVIERILPMVNDL